MKFILTHGKTPFLAELYILIIFIFYGIMYLYLLNKYMLGNGNAMGTKFQLSAFGTFLNSYLILIVLLKAPK